MEDIYTFDIYKQINYRDEVIRYRKPNWLKGIIQHFYGEVVLVVVSS